MTAPATVALIDEVVAVVRAALGVDGALMRVDRRPNGFSTKAASEFVSLQFAGGTRCALLVKQAVDLTGGRRPDPPDREERVYRALGGRPAFPAPRLVGVTNGADPYLVLEEIGGWDLRYRDLDAWQAAAVALGRMHAGWLREAPSLEALGFLDAWTVERAMTEAELALAAVHDDEVLHAVVARHEPLAAELTSLPATLVHGDLAPKNVVVDEGGAAFFVDWEWAGVGPAALDLVDLVDGLDAAATDRLVGAYMAAGGDVAMGDGAGRALELARLQRTLFRIGRGPEWGIGAEELAGWARLAAALHEGLTER